MKFKTMLLVIAAGILILVIGGFAAKKYVAGIAKDKISSALASLSNYADFNCDDVTVDLPSLTPHVWNLTIKPVGLKNATIQIADLAVYDIDKQHKIPTHAHLALNGITGDKNLLNMIASNAGMSLDNKMFNFQDANIEIQFQYAQDKQELIVNKVDVINRTMSGKYRYVINNTNTSK